MNDIPLPKDLIALVNMAEFDPSTVLMVVSSQEEAEALSRSLLPVRDRLIGGKPTLPGVEPVGLLNYRDRA